MLKSNIDLEKAISLYKENGSLHKTAKLLHTSHIRLSELFKENNIKIYNVGKRRDINDNEIEIIKKLYEEGKSMEIISKEFTISIKKLRKLLSSNDVKIGRWRNHIKIKNEKQVIKKIKENKPTKICPYCNWTTYDINNHSHAYAKHIISNHQVDITEHLSKYPEDKFFFEKILKRREGKIQCKICNKYLSLIDDRHLQKHNMNKTQYIELFGQDLLISDNCKNKLHECIEKMYENPDWERFSSNYEKELHAFLKKNNVLFETHNRTILKTHEIDIYIPSKNIAIEFNGNKFHTEWFGGKSRQYHLQKTKLCKEKNINLLHIFEDEYNNSKIVVFNKLSHILKIQDNFPRIMGRKCQIKKINKNISQLFLNKYHIQGYHPSTIHYGAYYENKLIAVMSFLKITKQGCEWELTRFASNYNYICQGVGGKLFKHFIREYNPSSVKSFADRRWTIDEENNLYIQLGFKFDGYTPPDYKYYNVNVDKYRRFHKFGFRKKTLLKKYPDKLDPDMTETEMVKELGYDRIWDCGLIKYIWYR